MARRTEWKQATAVVAGDVIVMRNFQGQITYTWKVTKAAEGRTAEYTKVSLECVEDPHRSRLTEYRKDIQLEVLN